MTVRLYKRFIHKNTNEYKLNQNLLDRGPLVDDLPLSVESLHYETEARPSFGKKSNCD